MTKKVAILTLHFANNYGAVLQVYALSKVLNNNGYDVEVIDYEMEPSRKSAIFLKPLAFIKKIHSRGMYKPSKLVEKFQRPSTVLDSAVSERLAIKQKIFDDFRSNHLNITPIKYTADDLQRNCPSFDAFVVGSDQVWAADFLFTSPTYLLSFVPDDKIKMSYAASFGKKSLESYLKPIFGKYVKRMNHVSVREQSGVSITKEFNNDVKKVLDPTLLLDSYDEIVSETKEDDYILVYKLNQEKPLSDYFLNQVENVSRITGSKVIFISPDGSLNLDSADIRLPTPNELLGLIKNAKLVLTNSFHGLVFSIIFRKKFLGFQRDLFSDKQNLRLTGLLSIFGLEKNLISFGIEIDDSNIDELILIDYDMVDKNIAKEKEKSLSFLLDSLSDKPFIK